MFFCKVLREREFRFPSKLSSWENLTQQPPLGNAGSRDIRSFIKLMRVALWDSSDERTSGTVGTSPERLCILRSNCTDYEVYARVLGHGGFIWLFCISVELTFAYHFLQQKLEVEKDKLAADLDSARELSHRVIADRIQLQAEKSMLVHQLTEQTKLTNLLNMQLRK